MGGSIISTRSDPSWSPSWPVYSKSNGALFVGQRAPGTHFPFVFTRPLNDRLPQVILGDYGVYGGRDYVDPISGNYFRIDYDWSRVLVYKSPLGQVSSPSCTTYVDYATSTKTPVAYWRFGETSGTVASSVTSNNGTYSGSPTLGVTSNFDSFVSGGNKAVNFNQPNDYVTVNDSTDLRLTGSFTIDMWVKFNDLDQSDSYLINHGNTYAIKYVNSTNSVIFDGSMSGSCNPSSVSGIKIPDTNWHHLVYTYDVAKRCINGINDNQSCTTDMIVLFSVRMEPVLVIVVHLNFLLVI